MKTLYNETTLNGRFEVMSQFEINIKGAKKYSSNRITTHNGEVIKGLNCYWVTKLALENIKKQFNVERACF